MPKTECLAGEHALGEAIVSNDPTALEREIDARPELVDRPCRWIDRRGRERPVKPLVLAEMLARVDMVKRLLQAGADIHDLDASLFGCCEGPLPPGHRTDDPVRFLALRDGFRYRRVGRFEGKVSPTTEEPYEGPPAAGSVVPDRPAELRKACFEGVQDLALGHGPVGDLQDDFPVPAARQVPQVIG